MKVFLHGLNPCDGRKLNIRHYRDYLERNGHAVVDDFDQAEAVLLWSCGFRDDYKQHSLELIRRLATETDKRIIVTGCLPAIDPERLSDYFGGDVVPWPDEEAALGNCLEQRVPLESVPRRLAVERLVENLAVFRKEHPDAEASFLDQFVKLFISQGCGCECTYCSEKRTFPEYRSFPADKILRQCLEITSRTGFFEVMLQADSAGEYGRDTGSSLPELIKALLDAEPRLRIGIQGLNPRHALQHFQPMMDFFGSGRALHLRLPIQSASDRVLERMNRGYNHEVIERIFSSLDAMGFHDYSTDIIVGFPGESGEDFQATLDFVLAHQPTYVNLSRFMESSTIPASRLDGKVSDKVKLERIQIASSLFSARGIFCNSDDGGHARERQRRMLSVFNLQPAREDS